MTEVIGIHVLPLHKAPDLEDIGVAASSIQQKGHIELEDWQYAEAERLIARKRPRRSGSEASSTDVPIEEGEVEGYDVAPPAAIRRAKRREARLVRDYREFLGEDEVFREKVLPKGASHSIYSDLFNKTRRQLVEAKAGIARDDVRMAIGQLADYSRFVPAATRLAVLLDAKPHPDLLDLLKSQGIAAIWRAGETFTDNAAGEFT